MSWRATDTESRSTTTTTPRPWWMPRSPRSVRFKPPRKTTYSRFEADIRSSSQVTAMFERVIRAFGHLDLFVNNAGVQTWKPLLEVTEEEWDLVIDTNLKGCFLCTQQAARYMKDHGGGVDRESRFRLQQARVSFSRGLYREQGRNRDVHQGSRGRTRAVMNIRVNCIAPGSIESERTRAEDPDYAGTWSKLTPLGRVGHGRRHRAQPWSFSPAKGGSFISGQTIWIDGALFTKAQWPYKK